MGTKAIVGLGNPGRRYAATRHNLGFLVVDRLVDGGSARFAVHDDRLACAVATLAGKSVLLAKPLLYMNRSGEAVMDWIEDNVKEPSDVLVVHDELDFSFGRLQLRQGGGTGGHRGLESLLEALGTADFARLRVGIGRPAEGLDVVAHVLEPFPAAEAVQLPEILDRAAAAATWWVELELSAAMNRANSRPVPTKPA